MKTKNIYIHVTTEYGTHEIEKVFHNYPAALLQKIKLKRQGYFTAYYDDIKTLVCTTQYSVDLLVFREI